VTDDTIETYLRPHVSSPQRLHQLERFINAFDCRHTLDIEGPLKQVEAPTLIAWGTDDTFFALKWSHWLERTIPGVQRRMELEGARLFFPEERASEFNEALRRHWT
jgi:pimeloyl-ACP methyl ester carboxylesterase